MATTITCNVLEIDGSRRQTSRERKINATGSQVVNGVCLSVLSCLVLSCL